MWQVPIGNGDPSWGSGMGKSLTRALRRLHYRDNRLRQHWSGVTQSRDEVKAWVRPNTGVLLRSGSGFDKAVYQEMLAA